MRTSISLMISLLLLLASAVIAQDAEGPKPQCFEPYAQNFDEFVFKSPDDLKTRAKAFEDKLRESQEGRGIIFVYGGKKSKISEIDELSEKVRRSFTLPEGYNGKIWVRDGGYRAEATIAFMLRPQNCTELPAASPDLTADQVEFSDLPGSGTIKMASSDLYAAEIHETEADCPAAAKAVRACVGGTESSVFIIIDPKGAVIFSKVLSGHPLIRSAAEAAAKKWYFKPYADNSGKPPNRSGVIFVKFAKYEEPVIDY